MYIFLIVAITACETQADNIKATEGHFFYNPVS